MQKNSLNKSFWKGAGRPECVGPASPGAATPLPSASPSCSSAPGAPGNSAHCLGPLPSPSSLHSPGAPCPYPGCSCHGCLAAALPASRETCQVSQHPCRRGRPGTSCEHLLLSAPGSGAWGQQWPSALGNDPALLLQLGLHPGLHVTGTARVPVPCHCSQGALSHTSGRGTRHPCYQPELSPRHL